MYYTFKENLALARKLISEGYGPIDACIIASKGTFNSTSEFYKLLKAL